MQTSILNKLSPKGRKQIIELEGKLREIQEKLSVNSVLISNSFSGVF